jgi:hypothetical protein
VNVESHEAGHALAAVLTGHNLDYVTVVPDDKSGGHASSEMLPDWWKTPAWLDAGVVVAAGVVGEAAAHARYFDEHIPDDTASYIRAICAYSGGVGSQPVYDTATLRWIARSVWETAHDSDPAVLGPEFNPAWATNPDGVREIAAHCWGKAIRLVFEHAGSLTRIARSLKKHRTLTGDQVTNLITRRTHRRPINPELLGTHFWLADYSRLVWRPHGMCRPATALQRT